MRARAFTLVEVIAVIAMLGLLAGAVGWLLVDDARRGSRTLALSQLAHADRMARLTAQRLGCPCRLQLDLATQEVRRVYRSPDGSEADGHRLSMPRGQRIERVLLPAERGAADMATEPLSIDHGTVDVAYSSRGRSITYAVKLAPADGEPAQWLLVSGLTGQVTEDCTEQEIRKLLRMLATGRED